MEGDNVEVHNVESHKNEMNEDDAEEGEIIDDDEDETVVQSNLSQTSTEKGDQNQLSMSSDGINAPPTSSSNTSSSPMTTTSTTGTSRSESSSRNDNKKESSDERKSKRDSRPSSSPSRKSDRRSSSLRSSEDKERTSRSKKRKHEPSDDKEGADRSTTRCDVGENGLRKSSKQQRRTTRWDTSGQGGGGGNAGGARFNSAGDRNGSESGSSDKSGASDSEDMDDDNLDLNEEMWKNMMKHMQEMMKMYKEKGQKKKKIEKMELIMDRMLKSQSDCNSREMRQMVLKNRSLFRSPFRDREFRERDRFFSRFRDRRARGGSRLMLERRMLRERDRRMAPTSERDRDRFRDRGGKDGPSAGGGGGGAGGGGVGGSGAGRSMRERSPKTTCKFYLEGKCHKGSDCPFPHDVQPPKKKDICKFYLQGFCGKGDSCLFMHGEFPCKFYHTGAECYSGDNCRFSHEALTEETRQLLKSYLDSGELPDEINHGDKDKSGPKKPPILGDPTEEIRTSYATWLWQQEMKELELAYKGTKRNLFCIDEQFVIKEKPPLKPGESEAQYIKSEDGSNRVLSYYVDTLEDTLNVPDAGIGNNPNLINPNNSNNSNNNVITNNLISGPSQPLTEEDDKLLEMSFHDEDLRPRNDPASFGSSTISSTAPVDIKIEPVSPTSIAPITSIDSITSTSSCSTSSTPNTVSNTKPKIDIAKILNVIQQTSSQVVNTAAAAAVNPVNNEASTVLTSTSTPPQTSNPHADFWQNILKGTSLVPSPLGGVVNLSYSNPSDILTTSSESSSMLLDSRDPRFKRTADGRLDSCDSIQLSESFAGINYKLHTMDIHKIDYSPYEYMYKIDLKLRTDPRLQNFFKERYPISASPIL